MARPEPVRRLIVNADDFGRSHAINRAIIRAHQEGILTSASLMVNGGSADEAVAMARDNPKLGVGLHLTLVCGRSAMKPTEIPGLVNDRYQFSDDPVRTGMRYFFKRKLRSQIRHEIFAQFEKFQLTGLPLDHVNGHLNMHLHPTVFSVLMHHADKLGFSRFRLTRDPFFLNARLAGGSWGYRASHAIVYALLSARSRGRLQRRRIQHTAQVFGLLQNARVDEDYIARLLPALPAGDSELYSHPSLDDFKHEFDALISPRIREAVKEQRIQLIRYQDL